jgi:hypothetical protein
MFKNWSNIIGYDCEVIQFKNHQIIYPIFKNGKTSLENYAIYNKLKIFKNKEISKFQEIVVFLRDPEERFISGVNTYLEYKKIQSIKEEEDELKKIEKLKIYDRHFFPQYFWLFYLLKYFRGNIEIKSVKDLYQLIPNRDSPDGIKKITNIRKNRIKKLNFQKYVEVDKKIIEKYTNKTIKLESIIKEFKNVVS